MTAPKTVALVDGFDDGHHPMYQRLHIGAFLDLGCRVLALVPNPGRLESELKAKHGELSDRVQFSAFEHSKPTSPSWKLRNLYEPLAMWRCAAVALAAASKETGSKPDLVFFSWLDDYIVAASAMVRCLLPLVFKHRWSGLFFHPWHLRIPGGDTRDDSVAAENVLRAHTCIAVTVLDSGIADTLSQSVGKPVIPLPDVSIAAVDETSELAREIKAFAGSRRIVGLLGHLSKRKGIMTCLRAAQSENGSGWCFVLAGGFDPVQLDSFSSEERALVKRAQAGELDNVLFRGERIETDEAFNAAVSACDVLYAAYEMFAHSSNIVTKAAQFEKPILVSAGYFMEECVREHRLGLVVDPKDTDATVEALACMLDADALHEKIGEPGYAAYRERHSERALNEAFAAILEHVD